MFADKGKFKKDTEIEAASIETMFGERLDFIIDRYIVDRSIAR